MAKKLNPKYTLSGRITNLQEKPLKDLIVRAYDQDPNTPDNCLGKDVLTGVDGRYNISFTKADFKVGGVESGGPDVFIRVYDGKKSLGESSVERNAKKRITIDWQVNHVIVDPNEPIRRVSGTVRDAQGNPLPGVAVHAFDRDMRKDQQFGETTTNELGHYIICYGAEDFAAGDVSSAIAPKLIVRAHNGQQIGEDVIRLKPSRDEIVDFQVPAPVLSDCEQMTVGTRPLLQGQGKDDQDLPPWEINDTDLNFIAEETGLERERLRLYFLSAKTAHEVELIGPHAPKLDFTEITQLEWFAFYAWFRDGQPQRFSELINRRTDELMASIDRSISQGVIPPLRPQFKKVLRQSLDARRVDETLRPAKDDEPGSLGDLLATIPQRLSPEKERIVAAAIGDQAASSDDFAKQLKKLEFDDNEIVNVQVTLELGQLTKNHTALVKELHDLRTDSTDASIRYLASRSPFRWLELAEKYGVPPSFPVGPELYAQHLEREVEVKYPTAVFAARVGSGQLELNDTAFKTAANFLASHPELELKEKNARPFVNSDAGIRSAAHKEALVETLQKVQRVQKLSGNWREAGVMLNAGFNSALDIVSHGPDFFGQAVGDHISSERTNDIYITAKEVHDTTVALVAGVYARHAPWMPEVFLPPSDETAETNLDNYPNIRKLFGNLTTCQCEHCQSVLSPAAYLVDLMRFIDPLRTGRGFDHPLDNLLRRRPDIAHLELTCRNTKTEIPYIDLVLEVLENAVGLPIEIATPYGFNPERDLQLSPLPDNVVTALRTVLQRSAISVGDRLDIEPAGAALGYTEWDVTDGARRWTLRHSPELLYTGRGSPVNVTDFARAVALLDQGQLPNVEFVIPPNGSEWDENLPLKGDPVVTPLEQGRRWEVQYTRAVHVEILLAGSMGSVMLETLDGRQLDARQPSSRILERLVSGLNSGWVREPLASMLPQGFSYQITQAGNGWELATNAEVTISYQRGRLEIGSLTYQSSDLQDNLKASPENRNPEAYTKLDAAVYPWTLPFNLWLEEVRIFLDRRGISRRELLSLCNPSGGTTDDAGVRESLGLSLSESDIIISSATRSPWEYWGLKESANNITDRNDERIVSGSWVEVLSRVSILLQQSGLNYRELLNVLQTRFVRTESPLLTPSGDDCNPSRMVLVGLTPEHLDRIHRFVRLWRKLGWFIFDLDVAISVSRDNGDLNDRALRDLAQLQRLHELLGLPIAMITTWWSSLTTSYRDHTSDKKPVVKSVYERLFLNTTIINPVDRDFVLNEEGTELTHKILGARPTLASKAAILSAVLGTTQAELDELVDDMLMRQELDNPPLLTLRNLSSLFRHVSVAKSLRLSMHAYLRVRALIATDPFAEPANMVEFVERVQFIGKSGFSVDDLYYLLQYTLDAEPSLLFPTAWAALTLSDLRGALQIVHKEALTSAEPIAEHLRKMLARIGWDVELIEEAVELFVPSGRLEIRIQGSPAAEAVTIPAPLRDRVIYRATDGMLLGSLVLTAADWNSLRTANAATVAITTAIDNLRAKGEIFAATLPDHLHRMQSFDLPRFSVDYDPQIPPAIPNELSPRCYFDPGSKQLVFVGSMTAAHQAQLRDSVPAVDVGTVNQLKQKSDQYQELVVANQFLVDVEEVKALFSVNQTPETRVQEILEKLLPHLQRRAAVEGLSRAIDLDEALVRNLLFAQLNRRSTLDAFLDTQFVDSDGRVTATSSAFPAQFRALFKLHKAALVCRALRIQPAEIKWLPPASTPQRVFNVLNLDGLPINEGDSAASFEEWQRLVQLFGLRDKAQIGQPFVDNLLFFLNAEGLTDLQLNVDGQHAYLAQALRNSVEDVTWAATEKLNLQWPGDYQNATRVSALVALLFGVWVTRALQISPQEAADAIARLNLTWPTDYQNPTKVAALLEFLLTVQRLGAKSLEIFSLTEDVAPTATNESRPGRAEAALARNLLRARYDETSWPEQLKPIVDVLREQQRSALVSYLITRPPENAVNRGAWKDTNDLYEHYLIDTEMGPCKTSTRILHATSAVQLFVQRCRMSLEDDVSPSAIDADRWKWMKNYRVWEANRKVFLYPENWIEPELRDDKSEIFKELEGQLLQNEFDNEQAEEILKQYLKQLEDISHLAIVGMYVEQLKNVEGNVTGETNVHIVGRTRNPPFRFFYRRWILSATSTHWTPWEHVPLDGVKTEHILPFVLRGDVYIAWPEITQLASAPVIEKGEDRSPGAKWQLQMSWTRRNGRGWSDRFLSSKKLEHDWLPGKDENQTFTFRVLKEQTLANEASLTAIDCLGAQESNDYSYSFDTGKQVAHVAAPIATSPPTLLGRGYMLVTLSGTVKAWYKDPGTGRRVYIPVPGVTMQGSLQIPGEPARKNFNYEYFHWTPVPTDIIDAATRAEITVATATTGPAGEFKVSFTRIVTKAMYDSVVRSEASFKLEVLAVSPDKGSDVTPFDVTFPFTDVVNSQNYHIEVHFRQNFEIKRSGPLPGGEPDRRLTMKRIGEFILLDAEDATIEERLGESWFPLGETSETTAHGSGYLARPKDLTHNLLLPDSNVAVWQGVAPRHYLLPAFPTERRIEAGKLKYSLPEVFVYRDPNDSYFIRSVNAGATRFQVQLDGHARAGVLRMMLSQQGIPRMFALDQQEWSLPTVRGGHLPSTTVDAGSSLMKPAVRFEPDEALSPYASYNTELFFHVPLLIANFLSSSQRFEEAQQWFHLVFDPTTSEQGRGSIRYWRYVPFRKHSETEPIDELLRLLGDPAVPADREDKKAVTTQIQVWSKNPFRPHAVARLRPRAYQFAVFFKYVDNLIAWGDHLFRQYTTESINEATQLYILAAKLLGQRPQTIPRSGRPSPMTYASVAGKWDSFSNAWRELEANLSVPIRDAGGSSAINAVRQNNGTSSISSVGMLYFCVPGNEKMLEYWDKVEGRLLNIRHCRNIEGVEQEVPLWQPPIDPGLLVRAVAAGLDISAVLSEVNSPLPYYRFSTMAQKASELCNEVKALGGALLSALEKKDAEQLSLLRSRQELELLDLVRGVREQQIEEANTNIEALRQSEQSASLRFAQYQRLLGKTSATIPDDGTADVEQTSAVKAAGTGDSGESSGLGITQAEQHQIGWSETALQFGVTAGIFNTVAGIAHAIPNTHAGTPFFGATFGGLNLGSLLNAGAAFFNTLERNATHQAGRSATIGQYERRQDEWVFQSRLALKEVQQIRKQIIAAQIRQDIATKELANHKKQIKNAEETDRFMREKYTNRELYQWMVQQISGVYFRTYQLAREVAKRAERAFRFELGLSDSNYIQFGYWDSLKKGLLAGEKLSHDLKRMEVAYLDQNKREYEITKHVSLLSIDPVALIALRETGKCQLTIPESLFDLDYPGHYLRRIKSVSVTIPCVTGPYTGVSCTLTLLKSSVRHATSLSGGYARRDNSADGDTSADVDTRFTDSFGAVQSIVTSSAQNDSGLFETNLRDERYLPFEGAGVSDSTWTLEMPSEIRQVDYQTISDVILHIRYTSRDGGKDLKGAAAALVSQQIDAAEAAGMVRLFSVRHEFPTEWAKFQGQTPGAQRLELALNLREKHYPFWSQGRLNSVRRVDIQARSSKPRDQIPAELVVFDKVNDIPTAAKKETLAKAKNPALGDLLSGGFTGGETETGFPLPVKPECELRLFFDDKAMADLWIAVTWSHK